MTRPLPMSSAITALADELVKTGDLRSTEDGVTAGLAIFELQSEVERLTAERDDARRAALEAVFARAHAACDRVAAELGHSELDMLEHDDVEDGRYFTSGMEPDAWDDLYRTVGGLQ